MLSEGAIRTHTTLGLGALLRSALIAGRGREIVYRDRFRMDYATLGERVRRLAAGLAAIGVGRGDVVAVMDWDTHRYLECYLAIPMMGAVLQTVNVRMSPEQLCFCLAATKPVVLLVNDDFAPLARAAAAQAGLGARLVALSDSEGEAMTAGAPLGYEEMLREADPAYAFPDLPEDATATTFHTTGTTGNPKQVSFTHRQLVLHALMLAGLLANQPEGEGFRRDGVYMPLTPLFHVHAWGSPYLATLLGAKQVYPGRYEPDMLVRLRREEGVSFSHCVPAVLQMILAAFDASPGLPIGPWTIIVGGSALSSALQARAAEAGITTVVGFGMSETGPVACLSRSRGADGPAMAEVRRAAGFPAPLVDVGVVDENGRSLDWDGSTQGELVLRSPWLTGGYVGDEAATADLWRDGWLHTQDIATIDPDGLVRISDRIKDVIKSGGEWVSSLQLEELIVRDPRVADVAVIAVSDERWGERPLAFVVPALPGDAIDAEHVAAHLGSFLDDGTLSRFAVPRSVLLLPELPRTSVGKPDKKRLRALLAERLGAPDATPLGSVRA